MEWWLSARLVLITFIVLFPFVLVAMLMICGLVSVAQELYHLIKKKEP